MAGLAAGEPGEKLPKQDTRVVPKGRPVRHDGEENAHTWGFSDTQYQISKDGHLEISGTRYSTSGSKFPALLPWMENIMEMKVPREQLQPRRPAEADLPSPIRNEEFLLAIGKHLDQIQISEDPLMRLRHCHGHSLEDMCQVNYGGSIHRIPDLVLYPENTCQALAIVQCARDKGVCILPFGGGTNVSQALACSETEQRTIAAVSTKRMNRLLWVDKENNLACIEAGAVGRHIAADLAACGMTLGHEPDSVEFSTLGGWVATKASGMKKNRYGNIEDIVLDIEVATPDGLFKHAGTDIWPRQSTRMDIRHLVFGSEGAMGIITSAVVKVFPLPEVRKYGSILFPSFEAGYQFMNDLSRTGDMLPASVRLVDNTQFQFSMALKPPTTGIRALKSRIEKAYVTRIRKFDPQKMVACTLLFEGSIRQVGTQQATVSRLLKKHGGMKAGSANGERGYDMTFAIAYIRDFAMTLGILAESFETSCAWSDAPDICRRVKKRISEEHSAAGLPGKPFVSSRISQVYHTGVCIYFYLAIFVGDDIKGGTEKFSSLEGAARDEIMLNGGSLSHHHGVGMLRQKYLPRVLSPTALGQLHRIKVAQDPGGLFPGSLSGLEHV
uniref:Alkylglycerone-phosphate synthase n=1 Tax=Bionectria ochroleuca TaxID=29856 RepID=A0A8H7K5Y5_BIOOC